MAVAENESVGSGGVNQGELGESRPGGPEQGGQKKQIEGGAKSKHGTKRIQGAIESIFCELRNKTEDAATRNYEIPGKIMAGKILSAWSAPAGRHPRFPKAAASRRTPKGSR